jgi:serine-type D-Ala-D-Ala carboxypeptidase (penicillin-binding protein 5/6)
VSGAAARHPHATACQHVLVAAARRLLGAAVGCAIALALAPAAGASAAPPPPALSVRAAILIEESTGHELYGVDANRELPIASTTKLMTALVTLEHVHRLSTVFTNPDYHAAAVDSQIGLEPGERMSVHDLLLALMLPSADDAAEDLAYNVGHHSVARFIAMMNAQARLLGLAHTHYSTPIGLDTPGNFSTAADLVKLAGYDLEHSRYFARIVALPHAVLHSGDYPRNVVNRNDLVAQYGWISGVKTGHTADAGYVLVASGHRDGMTLISAVLGTSSEASRDANTLELLDYGFANFRLAHLVKPGQTLAAPSVHDQPGRHAALVAASGFTDVVPRTARVRIRVDAPSELSGPMPQGARLGSATVQVDGRPLATVPLVLAQAVPAVSSLTLAARFITKPLMLVLIVGLGFLAALAFAVRRRRRARTSKGGLEAA